MTPSSTNSSSNHTVLHIKKTILPPDGCPGKERLGKGKENYLEASFTRLILEIVGITVE